MIPGLNQNTNTTHGSDLQSSLANAQIITLPEKFDVRAAVALKQELSLAVMNGISVILDASQVQRMSTAGCQLIISFAMLMRDLKRDLVFREPSRIVSSAFEHLGLKQILEVRA
jgi:phospholipid transport system transporter-binding protein